MAALNRSDGLHMLMTIYTEIHGQKTAGTPAYSSVTTLDDHQIDYYDSNIKKLIPKQDWMKEFASTKLWKKYIKSREKLQKIYRNNIDVLMKTLKQSHGDHTYQRMCGCVWDEETGESQGFDHYVYNGEDLISLDLKENRYIASVELASPIVKKWNKEKTQLKYLKQYYDLECVDLLKEFLQLSKAAEPKVSLLKKPPPNVPETIPKILTETSEDQIKPKVSLLKKPPPNVPETIPKIVTEDQNKPKVSLLQKPPPNVPETIPEILTEDQNTPPSDDSQIMDLAVSIAVAVGAIALPVAVGGIALGVLWSAWAPHRASSQGTGSKDNEKQN